METQALKSAILKIQALEKTILESELKDKYLENRLIWSDKLDKLEADAISNIPDNLKGLIEEPQ